MTLKENSREFDQLLADFHREATRLELWFARGLAIVAEHRQRYQLSDAKPKEIES